MAFCFVKGQLLLDEAIIGLDYIQKIHTLAEKNTDDYLANSGCILP